MGKLRFAVILGVLAASLQGGLATALAAATLTGETLDWQGTPAGYFSCTPSTGSITYEVAYGTATGNYSGIFFEDGAITFDSTGRVTSWTASFEIDDATGVRLVHGTKTTPPTGGSLGACTVASSFPYYSASGNATSGLFYHAVFSDGTTEDGFAEATLTFTTNGGSTLGSSLVETFGAVLPPQMITTLIAQITDQNLGPGSSLSSKLQAAFASFERGNNGAACQQLRAFEYEVSAQSGKSLPPDSGLINSAQQIETAIGC